MLFNSFQFIFLFLPVAFLFFFWIAKYSHRGAAQWLFAVSLFFYGWWNPAYVQLLAASIVFNYFIGFFLAKLHQSDGDNKTVSWGILVFGIVCNLGLLGYYKYADFFINNLNVLGRFQLSACDIILPLGISFFTFTQIAFLVDAYRGEAREYSFVHYGLFVTYFPHLVAGPILHHKEMMPQFADPATYRMSNENISIGLTVFVIGLFKKVVLADGIAPYATALFGSAQGGPSPTFVEAWAGLVAFSLQLYFDFSGYSDMAIGLSRLFGIRLPLNFSSPYKAINIVEFWRRWHMTLSRFLRDYLYFPLGGNRKGVPRRYGNLLITMFLGGLWHGASWNFMIWGTLHGCYMVICHGWHALQNAIGIDTISSSSAGRATARFVTFMSVTFAWVFFRAETFDGALKITKSLLGENGIVLPRALLGIVGSFEPWFAKLGLQFGTLLVLPPTVPLLFFIVFLLLIVFFMPNTQELLQESRPIETTLLVSECSTMMCFRWVPSRAWAIFSGGLATFAFLELGKVSPFLYFQF